MPISYVPHFRGRSMPAHLGTLPITATWFCYHGHFAQIMWLIGGRCSDFPYIIFFVLRPLEYIGNTCNTKACQIFTSLITARLQRIYRRRQMTDPIRKDLHSSWTIFTYYSSTLMSYSNCGIWSQRPLRKWLHRKHSIVFPLTYQRRQYAGTTTTRDNTGCHMQTKKNTPKDITGRLSLGVVMHVA